MADDREPWALPEWSPEPEDEEKTEPEARASYDARADARPDPTRDEVLIGIAQTLLSLQAMIRTLALQMQRLK